MSESDKTFDTIGKCHQALYEEIVNSAWEIAGAMVVGLNQEVNGKYVPKAHIILEDLNTKVTKRVYKETV